MTLKPNIHGDDAKRTSTLTRQDARNAVISLIYSKRSNGMVDSVKLRDALDDYEEAMRAEHPTGTRDHVEISIDRRGEGSQALKISVAVRSLDNNTQTVLGTVDREAVSTVLVKTARDIEAILAASRPSSNPP